MQLNEIVVALIGRRGLSQKEIAATWMERWNAGADKDKHTTFSTVESRLSDLRHGREDGIRFFFREEARRDLLLDILQPGDEERGQILTLAGVALGGEAPLRLVVDLSGVGGDPGEVVAAAADVFLNVPELRPFAVVVDEAQYNRLSIAWADQKVRIERVKDANDGWNKAEEIAGDAVIASGWWHKPYERWLAILCVRKALVLHPPDAIERLRRAEKFDALPEVACDLRTLEIEAKAPAKLPYGPDQRLALRSLALGQPTAWASTPEERLGLAQKLKAAAAATERERAEATIRKEDAQIGAALQAAGLPTPKPTKPDEWAAMLKRAAKVQTPPAVLRVGNGWHILNADTPEPWRDHPRVHTHRFTPRPTGLERLRAALASWTEDDYADDPCLERLIEQIDDPDKDELRYAASWISVKQDWPIRTAPTPNEPLKEVRKLLGEDAPEATILCSNYFVSVLNRYFFAKNNNTKNNTIIRNNTIMYSSYSVGFKFLFNDKKERTDDIFIDSYENIKNNKIINSQNNLMNYDYENDNWNNLDIQLSLLWTALRAAVQHPPVARLPDGSHLFRLGGGVAAKLHVRGWPNAKAARGSFHASAPHDIPLKHLPVWRASNYDAGPVLPERLTLAGHGIAVDVTFEADPLGTSLPSVLAGSFSAPVAPASPLAIPALATAIEEARRAADD